MCSGRTVHWRRAGGNRHARGNSKHLQAETTELALTTIGLFRFCVNLTMAWRQQPAVWSGLTLRAKLFNRERPPVASWNRRMG